MKKTDPATLPDSLFCPCGSGIRYPFCCEPLITGQAEAQTALALMRSRYTAYVLGKKDYLIATWAPTTRPEDFELGNPLPKWIGLQIHGNRNGETDDNEGYVDFSATYLLDGSCWIMRENSRFIRLEGKWRYQDGDGRTTRTKISRNAPCPCGSGRKFKRCCEK